VRGGPEVGRKLGRSDGARADAGVFRETIDQRRELLRRQDKIQKALEKNEARIHAINEQFSNPGFFATVSHEQVRKLENEQKRLKGEIDGLMTQWQEVDEALGRLAEEPSRA
jgi:predicted nuclease with TOPRIM domain